jgi:hypothetical protein
LKKGKKSGIIWDAIEDIILKKGFGLAKIK